MKKLLKDELTRIIKSPKVLQKNLKENEKNMLYIIGCHYWHKAYNMFSK